MLTAQEMGVLPEFTAEAFDFYMKQTHSQMRSYQKRGLHEKAREQMRLLRLLKEIRDMGHMLQRSSERLPDYLKRQAE